MSEKRTKKIEGYLGVSKIFGVFVVKDLREEVSLSDDLFTCEAREFENKKVRITIEELT